MIAHAEFTSWPKEEVPDADDLCMRIHRTWFKPDRTIIPKAFQNHGGAMSTDWSKYAAPEQTRLRARSAEDNAVARRGVGQIRSVPRQRIDHSPLTDNRAHTDVSGDKDAEARIMLRRIAEIVLPLPG